MKVLVTGASGFVGRAAVAALRARDVEVHGVGRRPADRLDGLEVDAWYEADVLDPLAVDVVLNEAGASHLLHLAWCTEHGRFWDDPANGTWMDATARLAESFRDAGGARFVLAGSCTQYDWSDAALGPDGVAHEHTTPHEPRTPYGAAKEYASLELEARADDLGLSVATGLVFFPYGPHEKPERLVPSVTRRLLAGEPAETSAGTQVRDFLHVTDCGAALAALVDSDVTGPVNIGSGTGTAIADVARTIAQILDREDLLRIGALPMRGDEPPRLVADVDRLRDEVGFTPAFDLESGLADAVDWWRVRA